MKRTFFAWTISMVVATAPMVSAQHGGGSSKPATPHGSHAPKPTTTHATTPHGGSTTHATSSKSTVSHGGGHGSTKTGTIGTTTTVTPVQQKLLRNTNLASKLQTRLPAGTNLTTAAAGFRNLGQFVAAVNVSHNLGIPFADLKTRMVDRHMSLGQAIQDARPATSNTTVVARHAETDAAEVIRTTESTGSTATKATKTAKTHKTTGGRN